MQNPSPPSPPLPPSAQFPPPPPQQQLPRQQEPPQQPALQAALAAPTAATPTHHGETELMRARPAATPRVWCLWLATLGINEIFRRRTQFIITDQRVVVRHGLINRTERSLPMARIQDISTSKHPLTGWVLLSSAGGLAGIEQFGPLWNHTVDRMAELIREQIAT